MNVPPTSLAAPLISVAVCTYNRAELLANVLADLCGQTLDAGHYEVLVVDNNSTDRTRTVTEAAARQHANVRYVQESNQGLSHARNRGWREARGAYVGYTDDDCRVPSEWLSVAADIIRTRRPAVFGGPYSACYNSPKPRWFKDEYESHIQGTTPRLLTDSEFLDGGNVFLARGLLEQLNGFDTTLGMAGGKVAYGEETELIRRMRQKVPGEEIYYEPRLRLQHLVRPEKMNLRWVARQRWVSGRFAFYAFGAKSERARRQIFAQWLGTLRDAVRDVAGMRRRDYNRYPFFQNYLYERVFSRINVMGQLWAEWHERGKQ